MMPTYTFEDEGGAQLDLYLPMSEAPPWGEWVEYGGRRMRRVVEVPVDPFVPDYECVIRSQPRWDKRYPRYTKEGHGVILNRREHENYKAQNPGVVWD